MAAGLAASLVGGVAVAALGAQVAQAAPGTPGVPNAPVVVYSEGFENGQGDVSTLLPDYVGGGPLDMTYTADPEWLDAKACNGIITTLAAPNNATCEASGPDAADDIRTLADVLGQVNGTSPSSSNHAVSAYTHGGQNPGVDRVEFETESPIPLASTNRFLTFSVNVAEVNCQANHALLKFYLLDGGTEIPTFVTPIDPCTDPAAEQFGDVIAGRYVSNGATLFDGNALGIRMRNGQGSGSGNDHAFDDIQLLDATPQLYKSFAAGPHASGQPVALTFTVTNTSELAPKEGWSFTDNLPAGVTVASPPVVSTTCDNGIVTAIGGAITVTGDLGLGDATCTATVNVTAAGGSYTNGPSNFTNLVGMDPPPDATVAFGDAPVANPDTATTPQDVNVTVEPADNDVPGPSGSPIDPSTVRLLDGTTPVTSLTVPGEGTYTVNTTTGVVTFDPLPNFTGVATPVRYQVSDEAGETATSTITITVEGDGGPTPTEPAAHDDRESTDPGQPVTIDVLDNDDGDLVPGTLHLIDPESGDPVDRVVVGGEGTWTVRDGKVVFDPEDGFTGTVRIDYQVADRDGTVVRATITVTVEAGGNGGGGNDNDKGDHDKGDHDKDKNHDKDKDDKGGGDKKDSDKAEKDSNGKDSDKDTSTTGSGSGSDDLDSGAPVVTSSTTSDSAAVDESGSLAFTGADMTGIGVAGLLMLAAGSALVFVVRRRRHQR